ncbi:MAG: division/cell wall cluster transcriptional repressor MraZ [Clostridia bacterium]|nr:division/cell wall cluster transcriptional repressor MraZ [Clostridia bacterium]MBR3295939.1 division/cell wall cluster transcriptional repressor MraZ [Clostridia bacterium]
MLIGEYSHSMDTKGRVFIPAKYREELGHKIYVTSGPDHCLFVFSEKGWEDFAHKLQEMSVTDDSAIQKLLRIQLANTAECEPDKQGRILLPNKLREYASLDKEVVAIGAVSRVELWSRENWDKYNNFDSDEYNEALKALSKLGI